MNRHTRTLLCVWLLVLGASPFAQTATKLEWDYLGSTPAQVAAWTQTVTINGAAQMGLITCGPRPTVPTDTTCSVPIASLASGTNTISIAATANGQSAVTTITGVDPAKLPKSSTGPRVTITTTIAF